jgi:membrane protein DedA with SNARE-associated domain
MGPFATTDTDELTGLAGWVVDVIERLGPLGVGALIALENIIPPIPSEVILPFAGFTASQGDLNVVAAWVAATVGSVVGALVLYFVGVAFGRERLEQLSTKGWFILFSASDLARGEVFFARHGNKIVLLGRFIPLVRSIVSVPAGIERMPLVRFVALTALGSCIWNAIFIGLGYAAGDNWEQIEGYVQPFSYLALASLALFAGWLVLRRFRASDPTQVDPELEAELEAELEDAGFDAAHDTGFDTEG